MNELENDERFLFETKEWAPFNFNFMSGCSNDCVYCYAKDMATRFKRKTPDTWKTEESVEMSGKSYSRKSGEIMVPSSHDITPDNIETAMEVLDKLLSSGNNLQTTHIFRRNMESGISFDTLFYSLYLLD